MTESRITKRRLNATVKSFIVSEVQKDRAAGKSTGVQKMNARLVDRDQASYEVTIKATEAGYAYIASKIQWCMAHFDELGISRIDVNGPQTEAYRLAAQNV